MTDILIDIICLIDLNFNNKVTYNVVAFTGMRQLIKTSLHLYANFKSLPKMFSPINLPHSWV